MDEGTPPAASSARGKTKALPAGPLEKPPLPVDAPAILEAILEHSPGLIAVFNEESIVVRASRSTADLMAIPPERVLGHRMSDSLSAGLKKGLDKALAGKTMRTEGRFHEPTDGECWVRVTWTPLSGPEGETVGGLALAEDATAERRASDLAERFAFFDPLTELPNRTMLTTMLERALEGAKAKRRQLALIWLNLDRFKDVNDALGQSFGDHLLRAVAARIRDTIRAGDLLGRVGGDDFLLILPRVNSRAHVEGLARRVKQVFATPFEIEGRTVYLTASCGVALHPNGGADAPELQEHAHTAMRAAKSAGGNVCRFYDLPEGFESTDRIRLADEFRQALENDHFVLHYQPQVQLDSMTTVGVEALVRWQHPERGLLQPNEFIAFAEQSGLIEPLGAFVLREGAARMASWHSTLDAEPRLAVNVSARELHRVDLCARVQRAARDSGLSLSHIEIEITETAVLEDPERAADVAGRLRDCGATVALDDFGTGYSSLTHLRQLPIDRVKIDRSFVDSCLSDRSAASILVGITHIAHDLGLEVVAEGVETQAQLDFLRAVGCDAAQGFHLAPPLRHDECADHLLRSSRGLIL